MRPLTKTDRGANGGVSLMNLFYEMNYYFLDGNQEDCTQDIKVEVEQVLPREESASCRIDPAQKNSGLLVQVTHTLD